MVLEWDHIQVVIFSPMFLVQGLGEVFETKMLGAWNKQDRQPVRQECKSTRDVDSVCRNVQARAKKLPEW